MNSLTAFLPTCCLKFDDNLDFYRLRQVLESRRAVESQESVSLLKQAGWDYLLAGIDSHVDMKGEGRVR